jgi:hypothetical protein
MSSPPSPLVWFLLLNSTNSLPYNGTTVSSVLRSSLVVPVVDQFRDAVIKKYKDEDSTILTGIASSQLLVYKNKTAFVEGKEESSSSLLDGHGKTEEEEEEDMLVVVVPSSRSSRRSTSESSLTGKEPNPKRKQRWIELNEILEGNAKKSKTNDSTAYIYVTWNQVKTVFNPTIFLF